MKYFVFLSIAILAISQNTQCPHTQTVINYMCIQSYVPVCAYSSRWAWTYQNSCYACMDANVAYYDSEACVLSVTSAPSETINPSGGVAVSDPNNTSTASSGSASSGSTTSSGSSTASTGSSTMAIIICNTPKSENPVCPAIYTPTCGLFNSKIQCIQAPCGQQFGNECEACSNANVDTYFYGNCNAQTQNPNTSDSTNYVACTNPRPEMCTQVYTDTCAFTEYPCYSSSCQKSASNQCDACSNSTVVGYVLQNCSDYAKIYQADGVATNQQSNSTTIAATKYECSLTRPTDCVTTVSQVCAQLTCTDTNCEQEFTNECLACSNSAVTSYYKGSCQTSLAVILSLAIFISIDL